ncbi:MAG: 2-succinyl-6-hydroxy-2,4-cyclohexadiene-1-carboxylate synthase, partial [Ignavibacteriaceae bacterium]
MIANISGLNIHYERYLNSSEKLNTSRSGLKNVLFIHGFTGSSHDWENIIEQLPENFNYYSIDLIGHGNSDSPVIKELYNADSLVNQLKEFTSQVINDKFILIGYSMGGRAALSYSVKYPGTIEGLILESSTAGIKDQNERQERIKKDEEIADYLVRHSIGEFIDYWMDMDIFNTQKRFANSKLEEIRNSKLNNNKTGLSNFLRGFGTGKMPPLYDQLKNITAKTLLISGELDEKFSLINNEMVALFPSAEHISIKNSGHNTHLERPEAFVKTVRSFLNKM